MLICLISCFQYICHSCCQQAARAEATAAAVQGDGNDTNQAEQMALFRTLPTPTNDLLPRLMVEVCLVLAPDVNFFLNSRKQGLPC